ncbi:MAG: transglutaminase domain-containing protein [Desulfobacterales bacterium]|nr:MAG: transglutaminase domain-containing protein [Desulfobacterales bacterium]
MQTLGVASAENKTIKKTSAKRKMLISAAGTAILAAVAWITLPQFSLPKNIDPPAAGDTIAKNIQYGYTLQNKTARVVEKAEFWAHAPVKQTAGQRCQNLTANYPFQLLTDKDGNQVLHFTFENLAPYASRIITIKADLLVPRSATYISAAPGELDLQPEKHIESEHPAIRRAAGRLKQAEATQTIAAVFRWVARHVRYSGYADKDRGALYALEHKKGDCTEYMDLFVALCRANGIPARRIGGYICPQSAVLKARDYHNWGEFYQDGTWQIADPQNNVLMQNQGDYIAMRIIRAASDNPMGTYNRFRVKGEGLQVKMN